MSRIAALIMTFGAMATASHAIAQTSRPESAVVLSRDSIATALKAFLESVEALGFSGAVSVARNDSVVLERGAGFADRAAGIRIHSRTVFDIGSVAKQFTAAAILRLEADGLLKTTDSLHRFFPNAAEDKRGVTLHHLLTHTSGMARDFVRTTEFVPRDSLVRIALAAPLRRPVGSPFEYSNPAYVILGAVIEQVSGKPLETYLYEKLWRPAGMHSTGFARPAWTVADVAKSYGAVAFPGPKPGSPLTQAKTLAEWRSRPNEPVSPSVMYPGAGAVLSTMTDLLAWNRALSSGIVLPRDVASRLFQPYTPLPGGRSYGYAWFVQQTPRGTPMHSHNGNYYSYFAEIMRFPTEGVVIVMASNDQGDAVRFVRSELPNIVFTGKLPTLPRQRVRVPASELRKYAGNYALPSGQRISIVVDRNRLVARTRDPRAARALTAFPAAREVLDTAGFGELATIMDAMSRGDYSLLERRLTPRAQIAEEREFFDGAFRQLRDSLGEYAGVERLGGVRRGPFTDTYAAVKFGKSAVPLRFELDSTGIYVNATPPPVLYAENPLVQVAPNVFETFNMAFATGVTLRFVTHGARIRALEIEQGQGRLITATKQAT